jgi:acyl-coenzyme A thioesterase PaaI-like protein
VALADYPPADHLLRDLGIEGEVVSPTEVRLGLEVTPHVTGADGGVRAGVLATAVDVVGGSVALRAAGRERMATADLVVEMVRPARGPFLEARAALRRRGRTTLVVEAVVFETTEGPGAPGAPDGSPVAPGAPDGSPVAWASMTFTLLPPRTDPDLDESDSVDVAREMPGRWVFAGEGLERPVFDALGIEVIDAPSGSLSMPALSYHRNSFGAVQGGAMALLAEAAGEEAIRAALGPGAGSVAVTGLQVAYLALGRDGPIESRVRVLDPAPGPRSCAVVELSDAGAEDRVTTLVNVGASSR